MRSDTAYLLGMFIGAGIALTVCTFTFNSAYEREAIKHNAAHYDAKTGAFTWNDEVKP